jgi:hypothetical protein
MEIFEKYPHNFFCLIRKGLSFLELHKEKRKAPAPGTK